MKCSVIIPTHEEEEHLRILLPKLEGHEVIVADAGSVDATRHIARQHGATVVQCEKKNRAHQCNRGAEEASCDHLLFLHADSIPPKNWCSLISRQSKDHPWGGFHVRFDHDNPFFRFIEFRSNWIRARCFFVLFGDQGIFVRRDLFGRMGGFPEVSLMEDLLFSKRLRHIARPGIIRRPLRTSPRRFLRQGLIRTYLMMGLVMLLYHMHVPLERIARWYR